MEIDDDLDSCLPKSARTGPLELRWACNGKGGGGGGVYPYGPVTSKMNAGGAAPPPEWGTYWQVAGNLLSWVCVDVVVLSNQALASSQSLDLAVDQALSASVLDCCLVVLGIWVVLTVLLNYTHKSRSA